MLMLWLFSLAISQALQVCLDGGFQLGGFGELRVQLGDESLHLLRERLGVVLDLFRADVAAWSQHVAVLGDLGGLG